MHELYDPLVQLLDPIGKPNKSLTPVYAYTPPHRPRH